MDHFIVGKENVFSFAKYESDVVSYNKEYQKSLKQNNKNKNINRKREFEL